MDIFYLFIDKCNFRGTKREKEHSAGLFLVEYGAKNFYNIKNTELEIRKNKPHFKYADIHFSISHSNNLAMVCFDKNPVGFDVELIKRRDYHAIAGRMNFKPKDDSLEEFYSCWTRYEAEYKLQNIALSFYTEKFQGKYMISAASNLADTIEFKFFEIKT